MQHGAESYYVVGEGLLGESGEVQLDQRLGTLTEVTVLIPLNPEQ